MTHSDDVYPLLPSEAERRIAVILARVEKDTGQLVRRVDIRNFDVTTLADGRPQWARHVSLYLEPIPGSQWKTT